GPGQPGPPGPGQSWSGCFRAQLRGHEPVVGTVLSPYGLPTGVDHLGDPSGPGPALTGSTTKRATEHEGMRVMTDRGPHGAAPMEIVEVGPRDGQIGRAHV